MKITNRTNILTRNLKTFLAKSCEKELLGPEYTSRLHAVFKYRKRTRTRTDDCPGGFGWYNHPRIEITLVKGVLPDKRKLAKVIAHELAHTQNVHHGPAMQNSTYGWVVGWEQNYLWADALVLTTYAAPVPPQLVDQDALKLKNAQAQLKAWGRKLALAKTCTQKWKDKVKYYQSKVAKIVPHNGTSAAPQPDLERAASSTPPENPGGPVGTK
jgi:hypothetical protein